MSFRIYIILLSLICSSLFAKPFRIAALYPEGMAWHLNCTCGLEAQCITKAAVIEAKKKGLDVSINFFETGRTPFTVMEAATKVANANYDAAIGTLVSAEALVASKVFEDAHTPFVVPTASHPDVTREKSYVTRVAFNDYRQAKLLAKLTSMELKPRSIAIIRNQSNPYSEFLGLEYSAELRRQGINSIQEYPIIDGPNDFKEIAKDLVKKRVGLVFVPLPQRMLASLYVELVRNQAEIILLGSDIVEGEVHFLNTLGSTKNNIRFIFVKHWNGRMEGPRAKEFSYLRDTYCKQYAPTMTGAAAFDAISLLLETLRNNPGTTKENLISRLRKTKFVGMTGSIEYDGSGDPIKPLHLFTIRNNKAEFWRTFQ